MPYWLTFMISFLASIFFKWVVARPFMPSDEDAFTQKGLIAALRYQTVRFYVFPLLWTTIYEQSDPNHYVQMFWSLRTLSIVSIQEALALVAFVAILRVTQWIVYDRNTPVLIGISLFIGQVAELAELVADAVLNGNTAYASTAYTWTFVHSAPLGMESWIYYVLLIIFIVTAPVTIFSAGVAIFLMYRPTLRIYESLKAVADVSQAYLLPHPRRFALAYRLRKDCIRFWPKHRGTRILFVADVHVSASGRAPMGSSRTSDETLQLLSQLCERHDPDALVFVGDMTDTGAPEEWEKLTDVVKYLPCEVMAVPGNHDIHFASYNDPRGGTRRFESPSYRIEGVCQKIHKLTRATDDCSFPAVRRISTSIVAVLLNSNLYECSGPVTNAVGRVGHEQLARAAEALAQIRTPDDDIIVILHHQVLLALSSPLDWFLQCLDGEDVLAFAVQQNALAVISGHLHSPWVTKHPGFTAKQDLLIVSCGSLHHKAAGPLSNKISVPSAYLATVMNRRISIRLIAPGMKYRNFVCSKILPYAFPGQEARYEAVSKRMKKSNWSR